MGVLSNAQINFESGYFIDNNGNKVECFIRNVDWIDNPIEFKYRLSENSEVSVGEIDKIKEFGVSDVVKYIRAEVEIDRSSDNTGDLSFSKTSNFSKEVLFLKTLIDGESSLYSYVGSDITRFFYANEQQNIKPLIYKKYRTGGEIGENNQFRQQLFADLSCESTNIMVKKLRYSQSDLIRYFINYNECANTEYKVFKKKADRSKLGLSLKIGANLARMEIERRVDYLLPSR